MKWCCASFKDRYDSAGDRSIAIIIDRYSDGKPHFLLQARAFERGQEPQFNLPVPMSLVTEDAINFCPWCGAPLHRWYSEHLDELIRPRLRIARDY